MITLLALLSIILTSSTIEAQALQQDPGASNSKIQSIIESHQKETELLNVEVKKIKSTRERMAYHKENKPDPSKHVEEIMKIIQKHPTGKLSEAGLLWTLKHGNPAQISQAKQVI